MSKVITAAKQVWSAKDQITRNIWLAGLGAYDKGYESASNTVTKSQSIFDELVERGRKLEDETTLTFSTQKDKLASASQNATDALQGKVHSAVTSLTHIDANAFDNIINKIEQIELALADAKQQPVDAAAEVEAVQEVIANVEVAVTEKVTAVAAEVTSVVENVAEAVSEAVKQSAPVVEKAADAVSDVVTQAAPVVESVTNAVKAVAKPVVVEATEVAEKIVAVKPTTKKVSNRRVKKTVAKKK
ncbi:hypothetical protein FR932_06620 [Moritella marina ATCC 15381]|uniref:Phasin family protein n=1 Tax=Moritella marina ATCC 15381 TaxID=1202962 RepID=A0A5J6WJZ4_MORMI|nr:phasin family protein [Moritella marina]QFI37531.1 hypothetical protein FR932_06620 [Moritella marina ATCC 15381]